MEEDELQRAIRESEAMERDRLDKLKLQKQKTAERKHLLREAQRN